MGGNFFAPHLRPHCCAGCIALPAAGFCGRTAAPAVSPVCPLPLCGISRLFAGERENELSFRGSQRGVSGKKEKTASLRRKAGENRRLQRRILAAESGPARPINLPGTAKRRFLRLLDLQFAGQDCPNRKERAPHRQPPEGSFALDLCAIDDPRCGALFSRATGQ